MPAGLLPVHMAWRPSPQGQLLRLPLPRPLPRGVLGLSLRKSLPAEACPVLARQLLQQCRQLSLGGILADPGDSPTGPQQRLLQSLLQEKPASLPLFLPESCARLPGGCILCSTAISGGRLDRHLQEQRQRLGPQRFALFLPRVAEDLTLPAKEGRGKSLSPAQLYALQQRHRSPSFYSPELMTRYFTYRQEGQLHFVLFDDAESLRLKLRLGRRLGARAAFFLYPEVREFLPRLLQE